MKVSLMAFAVLFKILSMHCGAGESLNHTESPKVCEKVLELFMLIRPMIVKFSQN